MSFESTSPGPASGASPVAPSATALARQARRLAQAPAPWLNEEVARRLADKLGPIRLSPKNWLDWSAHLGGGAALVGQAYPEARRQLAEPHAALGAASVAASVAASSAAAPQGWASRLLGRRPSGPQIWAPGEGASWPPPPGGVDLVWANMALHTTHDLPSLMAFWHRSLAVDGFLMASGLGPDTARELRSLYADLVRAGFADPVMDMERLTLTWATPEALLTELRTWGGNVALGRFEGWRTPRWRRSLLQALQERLTGPDGRLALTLELVYAHAIKPMPRAALAPETKVSLDDMRQMVRRPGKS